MCGGATRRITKPNRENSDDDKGHTSSINSTRSRFSRRQTSGRFSVSRNHASCPIGRVFMLNSEWSVWPLTIKAADPDRAVTATASRPWVAMAIEIMRRVTSLLPQPARPNTATLEPASKRDSARCCDASSSNGWSTCAPGDGFIVDTTANE